MEDDWDLHAVVRGYTTTTTTITTATTMDDPFSFFAPSSFEQEDQYLCLPDLFETRTDLQELEELYKPFFPKFQPISPKSLPTSVAPVLTGFQQQQKQHQPHRSLSGSATTTSTTAQSQTPRLKRRKNQQKRVVCQVPAEGLSSDMWAWRKYGQKPIKGSPYPRGYYRCSSSKGCLARKQVERSHSDPTMFIITYTAEHNHPKPTHRNSLAGSTRHKFSTPTQATTGDGDTPTSKPTCSSPSTMSLSPTTPLTAAMEDELLHRPTKKEGREDEDEEVIEEDEEDELIIPDMVVSSDDLFMGLEELMEPTSATSSAASAFDDCFSDHFPENFPSQWSANNTASAASGI